VACAGTARTVADALGLFGITDGSEASRIRWSRLLSGVIPLTALAIYLCLQSPVAMILASGVCQAIMLPVVGETWDGILNDIGGQHVRPEHVHAAFDDARSGPIAEGNVGGGTGLQCYGFKGGTGTASRLVDLGEHTYTVGVLVQANHGDRRHFEVNGVPVGQVLGWREVPIPRMSEITRVPPGTGSVLAVIATDAPMLPHQLNRLAQRAGLGIAKFGARGDNYSGDLMIAFSTAAHGLPDQGPGARTEIALPVETLALPYVDAMFSAVIEATAEAILNAMLQAESMAGRDDLVLRGLNGDQLADILDRHGRRRYSLR
jgi:D-aminopeptidase